MRTSFFHPVVLPALLVASAGFSLLTWSIAPTTVTHLAKTLPLPVSHWPTAVLMTHPRRDVSIRYGGFATLSSVVIGVGTAETMRATQGRITRRQKLLARLAVSGPTGSGPLAYLKATRDELGAGQLAQLPGEGGDRSVPSPPAIDWSTLLSTAAIAPPLPRPAPLPVVSALGEYRLCHIQGTDQQCRLAIQAEGQYYSLYRRRPTLEKAMGLIEYLRQRGQTAIATHTDTDYAVWVRRVDFPQEVRDNPLWSCAAAPLAEPA